MQRRRRPSFNPFISLTDVLFNLILVLLFAAAMFTFDIEQKHEENLAFEARLANLSLERDELIEQIESLSGDLTDAEAREAALEENKLSLEEQMALLLSSLDKAEIRRRDLEEQVTVLLGDLDLASLENDTLNEKLTVIIGELEESELANRLLETDVTLMLGQIDEAELLANTLREQVNELSRQNFLVVELEWLTERHDLDLHVVDPDGRRFYFDQASYEGASSRLTLDNRLGARPNKPGLEIWTASDLVPGIYRVEVGLWGCNKIETAGYEACPNATEASVLVRHRDGDDLIGPLRLLPSTSYAAQSGNAFFLSDDSFDRLVLVAEIAVIEEDGERRVEVQPANNLELERLITEN